MSEKKAAKEGTGLNYHQLKDVLEKPDGGYLLLTEYLDKRKTSVSVPEGASPKYSYKFSYGSVVVLSYAESMSRDWSSVFGKKQSFETGNENFEMGSFAYGIIGNKLNIIYNYTAVYIIMGNYGNRYWVDKSGAKIKVKDVFGEEALYPTFLTSMNLNDGSINYADRTFSSIPLSELYKTNNFEMGMDPSFFYTSEGSITLFSRMKGDTPKKIKFSTLQSK